MEPTARLIRQQIDALGSEAEHYVLVTPYGGLEDVRDWYSIEFREALERVTHIETGALDAEGILFDRRNALASCRKPEMKDGLSPVEGTWVPLWACSKTRKVATSRRCASRLASTSSFGLGRTPEYSASAPNPCQPRPTPSTLTRLTQTATGQPQGDVGVAVRS